MRITLTSSLLAVGGREITSIVILRGKRVLQEKLPCGITNKCNKKLWMIEELMVEPLREV
jgi:hypothetical protein